MRGECTIRVLTSEDAAAIASLESRCSEAAHWGEESYRQIGTNGFAGWACHRTGTLTGFILVRTAADEMEILNLAVDPWVRRQGIAMMLLDEALAYGSRTGIRSVHLEVRESNAAGRAFYCSSGFRENGSRAHYYSDPREDALLFARDIA